MKSFRHRSAFTLVELLVVIAIIGVLVALLLPAVQMARESARRMRCASQLKQFGIAMHNYVDTYNSFPIGHLFLHVVNGVPVSAQGGTAFGWGSAILPYIEQQALYNQFDFNYHIANTSPTRNLTLAQTYLPMFTCPSDLKPKNFTDGAVTNSATSSYKACGTSYDSWVTSGPGTAVNRVRYNGMFDRDNRGVSMRIAEITDGTSNQFMIAEAKWKMEASGRNRGRIYGGSDVTGGAQGATNCVLLNGQWQMNWTAAQGNQQPDRTAASEHPNGCQFVLADGSVRFVSQNIQHTATGWIDNNHPYITVQGQPYGLYQRLFSISDGLQMAEF
jgi:prepilin-type N-terminal cleavage/methylation domain-containing protein